MGYGTLKKTSFLCQMQYEKFVVLHCFEYACLGIVIKTPCMGEILST